MKKQKGAQASKLLTAGSYEYVLENSQALPMAAAGNVLDQYVATSECLLTWIRVHFLMAWNTADVTIATARNLTLVSWKQDGTPAVPNITDSDVIEKLRRDGKLFFLKHVLMPGYLTGRGLEWETEFRNVKLRVGESLCWGYYNHSAAVGGTWMREFSVKEYRLVTV